MTVAQKHIQHFNRMSGNIVAKDTLRSFLADVKKCNCKELKELESKLVKAIRIMKGNFATLSFKPLPYPENTSVAKSSASTRDNKTSRPPVERSKRSKATKKVSKKTVDKKKPAVREKASGAKRPEGLYGVNDIANRPVKQIAIDGRYKDDFNELYSDTQVLIWGPPGGGKTSYLLFFAQYLANKGLNVLFVANEEFKRSTFTKKMKELDIKDHPNLHFAPKLPTSLTDFDAIFLDSVQSLGMDLKAYIKFAEQNSGKIIVPIIQSTKEGDFRGGKDWEHEVDIAGEIRNRKLILRKNRLDPDFSEKSDKLWMDEMINSKKRSHSINQAVKQQVKEAVPQQQVAQITIE